MKGPDRAPSSFKLPASTGLVLLRRSGLELVRPLQRRHRQLVCAVDDLAAFEGDDLWRQSPLREPFNELAQTTAAHIALLIGEAQMLGA